MSKNCIIFLTILFFSATEIVVAKSIGELSAETSQYIESGDLENAMESGGGVIDLLIEKGDLSSALKLAGNFSKATAPSVSRFGYFKLSNVYHAIYKATGDKAHLITTGAMLMMSSSSDQAALALLGVYAKEYGGEVEDFVSQVMDKKELESADKILEMAINHIQHDRWELTSFYIKEKLVSVNDRMSHDGTSMLHMAVWYNKPTAVKELITIHGADISIRDAEGDTPLKYAKHQGFEELVSLLANLGAAM